MKKNKDKRVESEDYNSIKKHFGEKFARLCYECFQAEMEKYPGKIKEIVFNHFAPNPTLSEDMYKYKKEFIDFIKIYLDEEEEVKTNTTKTVKELFDEAGYYFYECHTVEDVEAFKKCYHPLEKLCTFDEVAKRLDECHIFWAVKKNYEEIKREDQPTRDGEYGTSVMSIQFNKETERVSIKNRYNHRVTFPDATLGNNLERIAPGLTMAFRRDYNIYNEKNSKITDCIEIITEKLNYVLAKDEKLYKYNYAIGSIFYCPNNIIIDNGEVIDLNKETPNRYILLDYFILDKAEKKLYPYDIHLKDSFLDGFNNMNIISSNSEGKTSNIKIDEKVIDSKKGIREIKIKLLGAGDIIIKIDNRGRIISYTNPNITIIGNYFLRINEVLEEIDLPNVIQIGNRFIPKNKRIKKIELKEVEKIGDECLKEDSNITAIFLPKLKKVGADCFMSTRKLEEANVPKLERDIYYFYGRIKELLERNITTQQHKQK